MRTVGNDYFNVAVPDDYWRRDRLVVRVHAANSYYITLIASDAQGVAVTLESVTDKYDYCYFDVSAIARTFAAGSQFAITSVSGDESGDEVKNISIPVSGDVNPTTFAPHPLPTRGGDIASIAMPSMMYRDLGNRYPQPVFECYGAIIGGRYGYECIGSGGLIGTARQFERTNPIEYGTEYLSAQYAQPQRLNLRTIECGKRYVIVRWRAKSGVYKCSVWELRNCQDTVTETVSIAAMGRPAYVANTHPVDERKGYETHAVLYLDQLTDYDAWYYSDIVTSDDVRVYASDSATAGAYDDTEMRVSVVTNSVEVPNGNAEAPYALSVEIVMNTYDVL